MSEIIIKYCTTAARAGVNFEVCREITSKSTMWLDGKDMLGIERSLANLDKRTIKSMTSKRFDTIQPTQSLEDVTNSWFPCLRTISVRFTGGSGIRRVQKVNISDSSKSRTNHFDNCFMKTCVLMEGKYNECRTKYLISAVKCASVRYETQKYLSWLCSLIHYGEKIENHDYLELRWIQWVLIP